MSDDYTPTTEEVRDAYIEDEFGIPRETHLIPEFDRWLNKIKAEAWDEGHSAGETDMFTHYMHGAGHPETPNPYRKETP